jgi:centromere protein C
MMISRRNLETFNFDFTKLGIKGRRAGVEIRNDLVRDEYGMEDMDEYFAEDVEPAASSAKSPPEREPSPSLPETNGKHLTITVEMSEDDVHIDTQTNIQKNTLNDIQNDFEYEPFEDFGGDYEDNVMETDDSIQSMETEPLSPTKIRVQRPAGQVMNLEPTIHVPNNIVPSSIVPSNIVSSIVEPINVESINLEMTDGINEKNVAVPYSSVNKENNFNQSNIDTPKIPRKIDFFAIEVRGVVIAELC